MKKYASRKFIIAGSVVALSFVALMTDQIGETVFRDLFLGALALYSAANVGQRFVDKGKTE